MLGVEIDGPVDLYGDNQSVIANTTIPSSALKKKHMPVLGTGQEKLAQQTLCVLLMLNLLVTLWIASPRLWDLSSTNNWSNLSSSRHHQTRQKGSVKIQY